MEIRITARHFDLTDAIREHINNRSSQLERFFNNIIDLHWVLDADKHRQSAEVSAKVYGTVLVGTSETTDIYASIDEAADKMQAQLKKYKSRLKDRDQKAVADNKGMQSFATDAPEAPEA
ncbi:MAG: hypothetical protein Kow0074_02220 [Candidatus Zixiibacteriota bacterium]